MLTAKRVCMYVWQQKSRQAEGFWTYILACAKMWWKCKNTDREMAFGLALQKTLTGRVVLKRMLIADSSLWCWYVCFTKSCACGEFFKTPLPVEGFWVLSWYVCIWRYVCFKSPVPVEGFSKPLSLWRVSDYWASMYVCVWRASRAERFGISGSSTVPVTNLENLN